MQYILCSLVIGLFLALGATTDLRAQNFERGAEAAKSGDFAAAIREWLPLAEQGLTVAQFNIGLLYQTGSGVPRNLKEAARWYELAGKQGDPRAQTNLGFLYQRGIGVVKDYNEAAKWFQLSAKQGDQVVQVSLGMMYRNGQGVSQDFNEAVKWYRLAAEKNILTVNMVSASCTKMVMV